MTGRGAARGILVRDGHGFYLVGDDETVLHLDDLFL